VSEIAAPINGKVTALDFIEKGVIVIIEKPFFASSEIVTCTKNDLINQVDIEQDRVSWKIECANFKVFYDGIARYQAVLVGVATGNAVCEMFVPIGYDMTVEVGQKVEAGMTVIGVLNEV